MKRYRCSCGAELFFENDSCVECGRDIGFDPGNLTIFPLSYHPDTGMYTQKGEKTGINYKLCEHNGRDKLGCNWLLRADDPHTQCASCRLTRTIPLQDNYKNLRRWRILESSKRRMIYNLMNQGLTFDGRDTDPENGLAFDFLEDKRSNPNVEVEHILTGHNHGIITINAAEADPEFRVSVRESMNERYRTILGHMRHEIGHYYFNRLVMTSDWIEYFIYTFGNPDLNYQEALDRYYNNGPRWDWEHYHISAYASMHPMEDWAETWAHYLHMCDTLETAESFGISKVNLRSDDFDSIIKKWMDLAVIMNALTRSVGKPDAYPFVISKNVVYKLNLVHRVVRGSSTKPSIPEPLS
ncbi:MAG: putative zinc-binding metallopeptidase [Deferribacterales bacterium]